MSLTLSVKTLLGLCFCLVFGCWPLPTKQSACPAAENKPQDLLAILAQARERDRAYQAPPLDELRHAYLAGSALLASAASGQYRCAIGLFQDAHFVLTNTTLAGAQAIAVQETPLLRRGAGLYVVRFGRLPRERLVQVPHSFSDIGTLEIGIELARDVRARALYVSTVHRNQGKGQSEDLESHEEAPADVAHQELSFFHHLTLAALATLPRLQVVQVHGFGDGRVPEFPQAAVVVSAGAAPGGAVEAAAVAERLSALLGKGQVLLYPRDTHKYGARKNIQGRAVATQSRATFLHLELSRSFRRQLLSDLHLRRAFGAAVAGPEASMP